MIALVLVIVIVGGTLKIVLPARVFHAAAAGTFLVAVPLAVWNIRDLTELFVLVKHQRAYEQALAKDYDLLDASPLNFASDYNIGYRTVFSFTSRAGKTLHRSTCEKAFTNATITIPHSPELDAITAHYFLDIVAQQGLHHNR